MKVYLDHEYKYAALIFCCKDMGEAVMNRDVHSPHHTDHNPVFFVTEKNADPKTGREGNFRIAFCPFCGAKITYPRMPELGLVNPSEVVSPQAQDTIQTMYESFSKSMGLTGCSQANMNALTEGELADLADYYLDYFLVFLTLFRKI